MTDYKMHLLICGGTGCKASESDEIKKRFIGLISFNYYLNMNISILSLIYECVLLVLTFRQLKINNMANIKQI